MRQKTKAGRIIVIVLAIVSSIALMTCFVFLVKADYMPAALSARDHVEKTTRHNFQIPKIDAPGTRVLESDGLTIDYSNTDQAYILVTNGTDKDVVVEMYHAETDEQYKYYFRPDGTPRILPLQMQGGWTMSVFKQKEEALFDEVGIIDVDADFVDPLLPYQMPSLVCPYNEGSSFVEEAEMLSDEAVSDEDFIGKVFGYIGARGFVHEGDFAEINNTPALYADFFDLDNVVNTKTGLCGDFASLAAAMIRSRGVPVEIAWGYTDAGRYHAWVSVESEGVWTKYDPTSIAVYDESPGQSEIDKWTETRRY